MSAENLKRKTLPFQLHIKYTKLNGMKCVRIISKDQPITWDRAKAEAEAKVDVLGLNAVQTTAKLARKGSYTGARFNNYTHQDLLSRAAQHNNQQESYSVWAEKGAVLETELQTEQLQEQNEGIFLDVATDDAASEESKEDRRNLRGGRRNDKTANMLWNMISNRRGGKK